MRIPYTCSKKITIMSKCLLYVHSPTSKGEYNVVSVHIICTGKTKSVGYKLKILAF